MANIVENNGERHTDQTRDAFFYMLYDVYRFATPFIVGKSVAEFGSGTGYGGEVLAQMAESVHGYEFDAGALQYACQNHVARNLNFTQADLTEALSFSKQYDVVYSSNAFEHLHDPLEGIRNVHRAMKSDGMFILAVPTIADYARLAWEYRNPFHVANWYYGAWLESMKRSFSSVDAYIQVLNFDNDRWNGFSIQEREYNSDRYSAFQLLKKRPVGDISETTELYANVVFVCRGPLNAALCDLSDDPISATRRVISDNLDVRGWTKTLCGTDAIGWILDAEGWVGGVDLVLGDAGIRSRGPLSLELEALNNGNPVAMKRWVIEAEDLWENAPTELFWAFYRDPLLSYGKLKLTIKSLGLPDTHGFNVGLNGAETPSIRLWETLDPLPFVISR